MHESWAPWDCEPRIMERERILRTLRANVAAVQQRRNEAADLLGELIRDNAGATEQVHQASSDYSQIQTEAINAVARLDDFIVRGTIPLNLQRHPSGCK